MRHPTHKNGQYEEAPTKKEPSHVGRAAYREFKANLATLTEVSSADDDHDNS